MRTAAYATLFAACTGGTAPAEPTPDVPDLVLVTIDTLRADRLGAYGDPLAKTPNLDGVATRSALFRDAITPVPLTLPAHCSILSGWYPSRHGIRDNGGYRLRDTVPLVSEKLHDAGYATGAFVGAYVLDGSWGLSRGFDLYHDEFHPEDIAAARTFGLVEHPGREVVQNAVAWWKQADGPRFMWVHLFDVHTPYEPSQDWSGDPYRGEVFEVDRALRSLIETVGDDAVLVIAGDHGESLWDAHEAEHGMTLNRSVLRVPLIIRPPGGLDGSQAPPPRTPPPRPADWAPLPSLGHPDLVLDAVPDAPRAARVVGSPVSLVDITPTLLAYAGLACDDCDGQSLVPAVNGEELPARPTFSETTYPFHHYGWAPAFASIDGDTLVERDPDTAAYAWRDDPWQEHPLPGAHDDAVAFIDAHNGGWEEGPAALDPTTRHKLEVLGYVTTRVTPAGEVLPRARDRMPLLNRVFLAQGKMASDPARATAELEAALAEDDGLVDAWLSLSALRVNARDGDGALAALDKILERAPTNPMALNNKVLLLRARKQWPDALLVVDQVLAMNPKDVRWIRHKVDLLGSMERPEEVRRVCREGLELDPEDPYLHYMAGLANIQLDDPKTGIDHLVKAREAGSRAPDLSLWEGKANEDAGNVDAAVAAYRSYARTRPRDVRPSVAAGLLLAEHDRCRDALPFLLTALERGVRDQRVLDTYRRCGGVGH